MSLSNAVFPADCDREGEKVTSGVCLSSQKWGSWLVALSDTTEKSFGYVALCGPVLRNLLIVGQFSTIIC